MITVYKNEDIPLTLTLGELEYEIDDYDNIIIYFYNIHSGVVLSKFSITTILGYEDIIVTDSENKICNIIIPDADTANAEAGSYNLSYKAKYTDSGYPDGVDDDIGIVDEEILFQFNPIQNETN